MSKIIWLASYPKSGNTWVRAFLANYQSASLEPVEFELLSKYQIASSRELFDYLSGIESSNLTDLEIELYRPMVFEYLASNQESQILKIHDAFWQNNQQPIINISQTLAVIYLIRNPLDVAISFAHHRGKSIDETITLMNNPKGFVGGINSSVGSQFYQFLGDWSQHVLSWVDQNLVPVYIIRYEDMLRNPPQAFQKIIGWCHLEFDPGRFEKALLFSSFSQLQHQEAEKGFAERPAQASAPFFRQGQVEQWRVQLSKEQQTRLIVQHSEVMKRFQYFLSVTQD